MIPAGKHRGTCSRLPRIGHFCRPRAPHRWAPLEGRRSVLKRRLPNFRRHRREACAFAADARRNAAQGTWANAWRTKRQRPQGVRQLTAGRAMPRLPISGRMGQGKAGKRHTALTVAGPDLIWPVLLQGATRRNRATTSPCSARGRRPYARWHCPVGNECLLVACLVQVQVQSTYIPRNLEKILSRDLTGALQTACCQSPLRGHRSSDPARRLNLGCLRGNVRKNGSPQPASEDRA